ncbi:hypothetical protein EBZ37_10870 [bacterium]|nr:hypothetical protein [bacterium]
MQALSRGLFSWATGFSRCRPVPADLSCKPFSRKPVPAKLFLLACLLAPLFFQKPKKKDAASRYGSLFAGKTDPRVHRA